MTSFIKKTLLFLTSTFILGVIGIFVAYWYWVAPQIPKANEIKDLSLSLPMKIFSNDNVLISEIGLKRRYLVNYEDIPSLLISALLITEDARFFEHSGIDYKSLLRATIALIRTGEKSQGASTITMQLARNFFLTREKSFLRKFREIFLAYRLEQILTKEEILTLYINRVFLGHRSYGFQAAAQTYFGKKLQELDLAEISLLVGLPKAPSTFNPISNIEKARDRRNFVIRRLFSERAINNEDFAHAIEQPIKSNLFRPNVAVSAGHIAEMARLKAEEILQVDDLYEKGYSVFTTIESENQISAHHSVQRGLINYIRRHLWTGVEMQLDLPADQALNDIDQLIYFAQKIERIEGLTRSIIFHSEDDDIRLATELGEVIQLSEKDISWSRKGWKNTKKNTFSQSHIYQQKLQNDINYHIENASKEVFFMATDNAQYQVKKQSPLPVGGLVYLKKEHQSYMLTTAPQTQAALVSLNPKNGAIIALVGGFNFSNYKFNRVTQARRQPGSNFKPFLYAAALGKGHTAASIINDTPISFEDKETGFIWQPSNYSGRYFGNTRLREALVKSRNLVSVRLLNDIGIAYTINQMDNFGFRKEPFTQNKNLSIALGSAPMTPLEIARGYAVFANGGHLITPFLVSRIEDRDGDIIYEHHPEIVCNQTCPTSPTFSLAPQTLDEDIVYIMADILREAIRRGTGRKARVLKRTDIAGKTGTTNQQFDAWFSGFNQSIVTTVWSGFDNPQPMGELEVGSRAALPIWIDYMRTILPKTPIELPLKSPNIVRVRIGEKDGKAILNNVNTEKTMLEFFRLQYAPSIQKNGPTDDSKILRSNDTNAEMIDNLFQ